jgi:hypothetical protein
VDDPELMLRVDAMTGIAARIAALDAMQDPVGGADCLDPLPDLGQIRRLLKQRLVAAAGQLNQDCVAALFSKGT